MARRTSLVKDVMDMSAKLPWQIGVGLAIVTFAVLHILGAGISHRPATPANITALGDQVRHELLVELAFFAQFAIPPAFLVGAAVSFFRRLRGVRSFSRAAVGGKAAVASTSAPDFELMVGEAFRGSGYSVVDQALPGPDGGVDLVVDKNQARFFVQCKHWRNKPIGVGVIRELMGVVASHGASGGIVVTSGRFTEDAKEFAQTSGIELIDGERLQTLVQRAHADRKVTSVPATAPPKSPSPVVKAATPTCPKCGGSMVKRTARQGAYAGKDFWACRAYPGCRGIVDISGR